MMVNDKSKFKRDLKLARAFIVFLGFTNLWIGFVSLHDGQCSSTEYIYGVDCITFGPYPTVMLILAVAVWLIYFSFSTEMKTRLAKHYT